MLSDLRRAWRLYQTDSRADTLVAVFIIGALAAPAVRAYWEVKRTERRG
jgi:hypothetical protein